MQRLIILFFVFLLGITSVSAYELVLPKEKRMVVSDNYAFFVGKANKAESITINDEKIYVASNGAFAHSVKLKEGENRILFKSNYSTKIYKIVKIKPIEQEQAKLLEFEPKMAIVLNDNTPMRSTPVDYGMNRISHLFKDTNLIIDGEKNDFYRVVLSKNKYGWVAKTSVKEISIDKFEPKFITMNSQTFKNASIHTVEFTEKLPYTIEESEKEIIFKVYNSFVSEDSVYTVNIRKPDKYSYRTISSKGSYVFKVKTLPFPKSDTLEGLNIVIDSGHGGSEKGAIGCLGDKEKDINLKIALELKDIIEQKGANVFMTRECDGFVSLDERTNFAYENCADIFISIHLDSISDVKMDIHKNKGTTVYYYNPNSKNLAKFVSDSVTETLGTKKHGIKTASFAVIRPTDYIGILVETAYMTNPLDSVLYREKSFPRKAACGIANGILNYVNSEK